MRHIHSKDLDVSKNAEENVVAFDDSVFLCDMCAMEKSK